MHTIYEHLFIELILHIDLQNVNSWNFNVFNLHKASNQNSLKTVILSVFKLYDFPQKFKLRQNVLNRFIKAVEYGYARSNNPYHNDIHAADVTQGVHALLLSSSLYVSSREEIICVK